ncbi:MAG TPA: YkgJ family cysteine cluster protein [Reyranella sp.]|nr:YkgJ family cysteine cluster protein [Reyranella sp.]
MRLSAGVPGEAQRTGQVVLVVGGERLPLELTVPAGAVTVEQLLPILRGLSSLFSARGAVRSEAAGRPISCRAGCGACCRQLVPLSPSEARALARLVDTMPEPRRALIRGRFEEALRKLDAAGLLGRMGTRTPEERTELGRAYFRQGIACPFLEDESCSIHPDRPMACREYLVTSPAENCRTPRADNIEKVTLEADPLPALVQVEAGGWVALILALRFRDETAGPATKHEAPALLREVIGRLVRQDSGSSAA